MKFWKSAPSVLSFAPLRETNSPVSRPHAAGRLAVPVFISRKGAKAPRRKGEMLDGFTGCWISVFPLELLGEPRFVLRGFARALQNEAGRPDQSRPVAE